MQPLINIIAKTKSLMRVNVYTHQLAFTICFILFLVLTNIALLAQDVKQGIWTIGGGSKDVANSIVQTKDGGYAVGGTTQSYGEGESDIYVAKVDVKGNMQWIKTVGGIEDDRGNSICETTDGGYVVAGQTKSYGVGEYDVYIVKLDASGNLEWTKTIGGADWDMGNSVVQTKDGGFVIGGCTYSFGSGNWDMYVIKLNDAGNLLWTRTIGGAESDMCNSICQTTDGGFLVGGNTLSFGLGNTDVFVAKLDAAGNVQWAKTIGGDNADEGNSVLQSADGSYIVCGSTYSFGAGSVDVYIVKLDATGNLLWTKTIGGKSEDIGKSIVQATGGEYVVSGYTRSYGSGANDIYLIKLDSNGNLQWAKTTGGKNEDYGNSVCSTNDGCFLVGGQTSSFGRMADMCIAKVDASGNFDVTTGNGGVVRMGGVIREGGGFQNFGGIVRTGGSLGSGGSIISAFQSLRVNGTILQAVSCNGGTNGSATVTAVGGVPPYSYSWVPSGGRNPVATGLSVGIYTIHVTDANKSTASVNVHITQPARLSITINSDTVIANGGTTGAVVHVGGGVPAYTYSWIPRGGNSGIATGLTIGNYTIVIKDANGCSSSKKLNITQQTSSTVASTIDN